MKKNSDTTIKHLPVMAKELIAHLALKEGSLCIDATFGAGGHTTALLKGVGTSGRVLACDRDKRALLRGQQIYADAVASGNLILVHSPFSALLKHPKTAAFVNNTDALCADLGLSSLQLLDPQRGFSFNSDAALDMRLDDAQQLTAATIINSYSQRALADIFYNFGEERRSFRFAKLIVQSRPFTSARQLADLIAQHAPRTHHHPATKIFQALRIAVNNELDELTHFLPTCLQLLAHGGRAAFISFHSLEDRIVKHFMRHSAGRIQLPDYGDSGWAKIIKPFPIFPSPDEVYNNRRARSAKLRIIEKTL